MRSGVPWSVKGIEPEAREAAKQAAQRAGVTLGAWLNQMIMDAGTDEVGRAGAETPRAPFAQSVFSQPVPAVDLAPVAEVMREIVNRVESSEKRSTDLARRLEQTVGQLAERLDHSERAMEHVPDQRTLDPLERKIQQLAERLEESERGRGGRRGSDDKSIQALEKAVSAVVDHLDTAERRTEESLSEIRQTLAKVAHRVDERDEEEEREEAQARSRALETHLQTLAGRLEKMEHSVSGVSAQAVETALKAIADKTDAEQHKATIAALQRNLGEITHRLERAEQRTDETLKTFEMTVTNIARRLDDLDTPRAQADVAQIIDARLEQVTNRLHDNEQMTLQAVQTIERAIAGMSDSLHVAENRSRETIESLHVMLERMTDRLGRLEKETKAARTQPAQMLSPQISVGGAGSGFVPGAQGFPIPNFDTPPMGGFGAPSAEFRSPFADPGLAEAQQRALPAAPSPADVMPERVAPEPVGDIPPPPFAADEDELELRDAEPEISNPALEQARTAHDFLAAARRAAQAAAQNGRGPQQPGTGPAPYAESSARFTAFDDAREGRRKRVLMGVLAAVILAAAGFAAVRYLNNQPLVPVVDTATESAPETVKPAPAATDMPAAKPADTNSAVTVPAAAVPASQEHPEAKPDDAGAKATVPSNATAPASTTPAAQAPAKAEPVSPIVPLPKKTAPHSTTTIPRAEAKGPTLTPAPAKPVDSAPLGQTSDQAVPTGDRALRAAAMKGEPAAQYEVGQRYANGDGVSADPSQAAYWYGQAADQGLAIAQYRLATLYEKGRGVAQDDVQARKWYEKAAAQGNIKAMHNLAVIYAEGRGTRQDFTTAAHWFEQAAGFGLGDSEYNLAILQERGLGVQQDYAAAYKWLSIAAKGGDKGAAQKRDELAAKLDAATLAQAKVAAETWTPKRPDPLSNGDLSSLTGGSSNAAPDTTGSLATPQNAIGRAQAMLMKLGYDPGSSDGMMGPRTRDAILTYQRSAGLDQTGNADPALLKSLELATQ